MTDPAKCARCGKKEPQIQWRAGVWLCKECFEWESNRTAPAKLTNPAKDQGEQLEEQLWNKPCCHSPTDIGMTAWTCQGCRREILSTALNAARAAQREEDAKIAENAAWRNDLSVKWAEGIAAAIRGGSKR